MLALKRKERLEHIIANLKNRIGFVDNSGEDIHIKQTAATTNASRKILPGNLAQYSSEVEALRRSLRLPHDWFNSNKTSNIPLITKQSQAKPFSKNEKRKFMNSLTREASSEMAPVVPPKKTRGQLKNGKHAVQQKNGHNLEMAMYKTSANNVNDQNDKNLSSESTKVKLPSFKSLHGPDCTCDEQTMTDELSDIIIGTVLKGVFKFIGLKEKK